MMFASVIVVVVFAVRISLILQSPGQEFPDCLVRIPGDSRVKLDAQLRKCLLHSCADSPANDCVDSLSLQVWCECAVSVSVSAYDFGMCDSFSVRVIQLEILGLAEMLEDICSVKRCCNSQVIIPPQKLVIIL